MQIIFHFKKIQGKGNILKASEGKTKANVIIATTLNTIIPVELPDKINKHWKKQLAEKFKELNCCGGGFFYGTHIVNGEELPFFNNISAIKADDFAVKAANIILKHRYTQNKTVADCHSFITQK